MDRDNRLIISCRWVFKIVNNLINEFGGISRSDERLFNSLSDLFHHIKHEGSLYNDPFFKGTNTGYLVPSQLRRIKADSLKQPDVFVSRRTVKSCCEFLWDKRKTFLYFDFWGVHKGLSFKMFLFLCFCFRL